MTSLYFNKQSFGMIAFPPRNNQTYHVLDNQLIYFSVLRARRNEKELKVKPATSFKYFQYLLTKN